VVNVLDMEEATIQTIAFPQVPKAGANTTSMLLVVAALIGAGGLLVGTTRVRRGQPA
jgi:LPXTG-motif cell wall-anchored protein